MVIPGCKGSKKEASQSVKSATSHTAPEQPSPSPKALAAIFTLMLPNFSSDLSFEIQTSGGQTFLLG